MLQFELFLEQHQVGDLCSKSPWNDWLINQVISFLFFMNAAIFLRSLLGSFDLILDSNLLLICLTGLRVSGDKWESSGDLIGLGPEKGPRAPSAGQSLE